MRELIDFQRAANDVSDVGALKASSTRKRAADLRVSLPVKVFVCDSLEILGVNESLQRVATLGAFRIRLQKAGHGDYDTPQRAGTPVQRETAKRPA